MKMGMERWWNDTDRGEPRNGTTSLIRIKWDGEPSGYAENSDNLIFL